MLDAGADIEARWGTGGETPLMRAALVGNANAVDLLIRRGADVNARTSDGWTPLHWAVTRESASAAKVLLAHGADPSAADNSGETPWERARKKKNLELERVFRDAGCTDEYSVAFDLRSEAIEQKYDFFVSYRHQRYREGAKWLKQQLEEAGCNVFLDVEADELAEANSGRMIPPERLKTMLYRGVRSARFTLFFEAWDERKIDPKTGKSSDAFNWQRFEQMYSNGCISLQHKNIRDPETVKRFVRLVREPS